MVTFLATAYGEKYDAHMFVGALLCQTNPSWKLIVYHDGPNPSMQRIVASFGDSRITYKESPARVGSWGAPNRIDALHTMVDTEYVVQSSVQDYWCPTIVEEIASQRPADFIYWNSVHYSRDYTLLEVEPKVGSIDWGNFAIKTELARKIGINNPESYTADGEFVLDAMRSPYVHTKAKIAKILTIKN
jgi:hypothetical protein